jgi:molecular chaperone Hsp33
VLQVLPNASDEAIAKAEEVMQKFSNISTLIKQKTIEEIISEYFGETAPLEEYHPVYKCLCSKEYIESILISMGEKELRDIIKEQGKISVNCQFCEKDYEFDAGDVEKLIQEGKNKG